MEPRLYSLHWRFAVVSFNDGASLDGKRIIEVTEMSRHRQRNDIDCHFVRHDHTRRCYSYCRAAVTPVINRSLCCRKQSHGAYRKDLCRNVHLTATTLNV